MSEVYELCCDLCKVRVIVGQAPYGKPQDLMLYSAKDSYGLPYWSPATAFFRHHLGHPLRIMSPGVMARSGAGDEWEDYVQLDDEDPDLKPVPVEE